MYSNPNTPPQRGFLFGLVDVVIASEHDINFYFDGFSIVFLRLMAPGVNQDVYTPEVRVGIRQIVYITLVL
jgi:hypothetical protein